MEQAPKQLLLSRGSSSNFFGMSEDAFVVAPTRKHTATIIFMHGLGETGEKWSKILSKLTKPNVKVICPNAKKLPLTLNKGFPTAAWFDIHHLDEHTPEDESSILRAMDNLHGIIDQELSTSRVPASKVIIGGFSQGGALAVYSALNYPKRFGGIFIMSSWIPMNKTFPDAASSNENTPTLHCHGTDDPVIPFRWGQITSDVMSDLNPKYVFNVYEGLKHEVNEKELQDIKTFIDKILP
ncbi:acyl-protein thioesterase 2-like isoform X2 [Adelges cooleyi]|uniref:acyl-protein thioesterase 2-like isoform X2 n=1 Tax=Adelges cooleyi TaxID=133065 RepID=UPI00217F2F0B|nr:acyl-protein thioesterase 2-like isoform X2 [Adelges cooleyi]